MPPFFAVNSIKSLLQSPLSLYENGCIFYLIMEMV